MSAITNRLKLKPRHRWFSHYCAEADDGFYGPHKTIEAAILEVVSQFGPDETGGKVIVMQGYKMNKAEREEMGVDYDWQCDSREALTFLYPAP